MIDSVLYTGPAAWLETQFALPRDTSHWDWLTSKGFEDVANINSQAGYDASMWRQAIAASDPLRQRVALALLDFLVVGINGLSIKWRAFAMAAYNDLLLDHAFGNYRELLGAIARNAAMGSFLTIIGGKKEDPATGRTPDENFARELMQLFTLGLYQLEQDGSLRISNGVPQETYTLEDIAQLARVFTGFEVGGSGSLQASPERLRAPMTISNALNEKGTATFLGGTVSGGGFAAVDAALDIIFLHPNVAPFVSKQLIQRMVTSNPSHAYVGRVAAAFANNGSGVRGDMKAVIRAILLDPEARDDVAARSTTSAGRLRDPVQRVINWARAFGVSSASDEWAIGDTSNTALRLGQSIGRAPSVFGFMRPGYSPGGSPMAEVGMVAPEMQIANEQTNIGYINFMQSLVGGGVGDVRGDYSSAMAIAHDSQKLVDEVNLVLAAGQLRPATVAAICNAVDSLPMSGNNAALNRTGIAVLLTLASPDYLVLK